MQNLDWNKCFQRVSDAGLHFPSLFPFSGWHVFVFPLVRPPRTTGEACPPLLSSSALVHLGEVAEGRYQYQLLEAGRGKSTPTTTNNMRLDSRFAINVLYRQHKGNKLTNHCSNFSENPLGLFSC